MSIFFVVLSTLTLTLNTMPEFRTRVFNQSLLEPYTGNDSAVYQALEDQFRGDEANYYYVENHVFEMIEVICIAWFTLEYVLRYSVSRLFYGIVKEANVIGLYFSLLKVFYLEGLSFWARASGSIIIVLNYN